jgi:Dyp-type peroxidase family
MNRTEVVHHSPLPSAPVGGAQHDIANGGPAGHVTPVAVPTLTPSLPLRRSLQIQGNILAGFRKDHQTLLFLGFPVPDDAARYRALARAWLAALLPRIARTKEVANFNERYSAARRQRGGDDPENLTALWINVGLTYHGLVAFGPTLAADVCDPAYAAFCDGPARRALALPELGDTGRSDPTTWIVGGAGQPIVDALLTIAADDPDDLWVELEKQRALATKYGLSIIFEQRGDTLPGRRAGHEHFGFKDALSQPGVRGFDFPGPTAADSPDGQDHSDEVRDHPGSDLINPGEFVLGYPRQPDAGGDTLARPFTPWMRDGSFQVVRRLAQDVPGFWGQVTKWAHKPAFAHPLSEDLLAAKLVGRWRSGTPLDLAPESDNRSQRDPRDDNNFEFEDDERGDRCPRFAHIRKMYPRDDQRCGDQRRRILRRGIPFGLPFDPAAGRGHGVDAERGLLFIAFMASIPDQFEFLQAQRADNSGFPEACPATGADPIIGVAQRPAPVTLRRPGEPDQALELKRFIYTTGAVYAFAPALATLAALADGSLG